MREMVRPPLFMGHPLDTLFDYRSTLGSRLEIFCLRMKIGRLKSVDCNQSLGQSSTVHGPVGSKFRLMRLIGALDPASNSNRLLLNLRMM